MIGAIAGDIIGSIYEVRRIKVTNFPLFRWECTFTDDTVLTVAVADAIMTGKDYAEAYREWFRHYPNRGFGWKFRKWAQSPSALAYGSWGNGSAMRVSPIGQAFSRLEDVLVEAERSAMPTHDHPTAVAGAQATAGAVFLAGKGISKAEIRAWAESAFGYRFDESVDSVRKWYRFDPSRLGTVPFALLCFFEAESYEETVRLAVSLGGIVTRWPASPVGSRALTTASRTRSAARRSTYLTTGSARRLSASRTIAGPCRPGRPSRRAGRSRPREW